MFQPAGVDLIWLSTSALFPHVNIERGYLGLKGLLPLCTLLVVTLRSRISDASSLCGLAGSHGVLGEGALERREFVGGEACHHPPVDSYSVSSLIHILIRGNVLAAVVRGYSANVDGNVLDAPSVLLAR